MSRAAHLARRFGLVVIGAVVLVVGVVLLTRPTPASFGWTAYAPLSNTTFVPGFEPSLTVPGAILLGVGIALIAGWTGFALGRRARRG